MARDDLIWENRALGTKTYYSFDDAEGTYVLETVQDIEPILEYNKQALNNVDNRRFGDGKLVAQIPIVVMLQLVQQGILSPKFGVLDEKRFSDWLNSSDNMWMRTWPGRI